MLHKANQFPLNHGGIAKETIPNFIFFPNPLACLTFVALSSSTVARFGHSSFLCSFGLRSGLSFLSFFSYFARSFSVAHDAHVAFTKDSIMLLTKSHLALLEAKRRECLATNRTALRVKIMFCGNLSLKDLPVAGLLTTTGSRPTFVRVIVFPMAGTQKTVSDPYVYVCSSEKRPLTPHFRE